MNFNFFIIIFLILLSACASKSPLPGKRINMFYSTAQLHESMGKAGIIVPPQMENVHKNNGNIKFLWPMKLLWKVQFGDAGSGVFPLLSSPVIIGDKVYTLDAHYVVRAFQIYTGKIVWSYNISLPSKDSNVFGGGLSYSNGRLYISTGYGLVLALDPSNGKKIWQYCIHDIVRRAPVSGNGFVVINTITNRTYTFNDKTGQLIRAGGSNVLVPTILLGGSVSSIEGNILISAYSSNDLIIQNLSNGRILWHTNVALQNSKFSLIALSGIYASPVISNNIIYIINTTSIGAFRLSTGQELWNQPVGGIYDPWIAGNVLYVILNTGQLAAFNKITGKIAWITTLEGERAYYNGLMMLGSSLIVFADKTMFVINPHNGQLIEKKKMPRIRATPIVAHGILFLQTESGDLLAYR